MKHVRVGFKFGKACKDGRRRGTMWYYTPPVQWRRRKFRKGPVTGENPTVKMMIHWDHELAIMAQQWEDELNDRARDALIYMPVVTGAQRFCLWCEGEYERGTIVRMDKNLRRFVAWIQKYWGTRNMSSLRTMDYSMFRDYLLDAGLAKSTVCCSLYDLSSWNKWALGESYVTQNFARLVNKPNYQADDAPLPIEGADGFWEVINSQPNDYRVAVLGLLGTTGMRLEELRELRWDSSWDYFVGTLTIGAEMRDTRTKRHGRVIPACDMTRHYLQMLWLTRVNDGPYVCGVRGGRLKLSSQINHWLKPLGLSPKNFRQWFRTSLITVLRVHKRPAGHDLINDILGHMFSKVRQAYERRDNYPSMIPLISDFNNWLMAARPLERPELTEDDLIDEAWRDNDCGLEDEDF